MPNGRCITAPSGCLASQWMSAGARISRVTKGKICHLCCSTAVAIKLTTIAAAAILAPRLRSTRNNKVPAPMQSTKNTPTIMR